MYYVVVYIDLLKLVEVVDIDYFRDWVLVCLEDVVGLICVEVIIIVYDIV